MEQETEREEPTDEGGTEIKQGNWAEGASLPTPHHGQAFPCAAARPGQVDGAGVGGGALQGVGEKAGSVSRFTRF